MVFDYYAQARGNNATVHLELSSCATAEQEDTKQYADNHSATNFLLVV